ncbi:MAG: hypothetical protein IPP29_06470 [Bacteroidetes bacterium]|nr:hypothetical protein [Bacteroidota bacterium]
MKIAIKNNNVVDYLDELMQGSKLLSTYNVYNPTGTNDPFYEPYTFTIQFVMMKIHIMCTTTVREYSLQAQATHA